MASKKSFYQITLEYLEKIEKEQAANFKKAGVAIGDAIIADKLIHVVEPGGHTNLPAYDMFYRAAVSQPSISSRLWLHCTGPSPRPMECGPSAFPATWRPRSTTTAWKRVTSPSSSTT